MNEMLVRARLAAEVRQQATELAREIARQPALDAERELPNHRVSQLAASLSQGQTPAERLTALTRELTRLWEDAHGADEGRLYRLLLQRLGLQNELRELKDRLGGERANLRATLAEETDPKRLRARQRDIRAREKALKDEMQRYQGTLRELEREPGPSWAAPVLRRLEPLDVVGSDPNWSAQVRLAIALAALAALSTLQRSRTLRASILERGGEVVWQ